MLVERVTDAARRKATEEYRARRHEPREIEVGCTCGIFPRPHWGHYLRDFDGEFFPDVNVPLALTFERIARARWLESKRRDWEES